MNNSQWPIKGPIPWSTWLTTWSQARLGCKSNVGPNSKDFKTYLELYNWIHVKACGTLESALCADILCLFSFVGQSCFQRQRQKRSLVKRGKMRPLDNGICIFVCTNCICLRQQIIFPMTASCVNDWIRIFVWNIFVSSTIHISEAEVLSPNNEKVGIIRPVVWGFVFV